MHHTSLVANVPSRLCRTGGAEGGGRGGSAAGLVRKHVARAPSAHNSTSKNEKWHVRRANSSPPTDQVSVSAHAPNRRSRVTIRSTIHANPARATDALLDGSPQRNPRRVRGRLRIGTPAAYCIVCEGCSTSRQIMPSRQERRKAERDAAKRAPGQAGAGGAGGAGGAATALANLSVNPGGDWTTQAADPAVSSARTRDLEAKGSRG